MVVKPAQAVSTPWGLSRNSVYLLVPLLCTFVVIAVIYMSKDPVAVLPMEDHMLPANEFVAAAAVSPAEAELVEDFVPVEDEAEAEAEIDRARDRGEDESLKAAEKCDLFDGKWVYDNKTYPSYKEKECSFMSDQLACQKYGRLELDYQFWKWQPRRCDMPRFNATVMLERLRDKRLVFVGDSLNRGQWVSMVCLVDTVIPSNLKTMTTNGSLITFKAIEYNATIEFYWAPLLVESNSDHPIEHKVPERIARVQAIEKHARHWTDADILVFNSYLWWRRPSMKIVWGSLEGTEGIYKDVEMPRCYEMAMKTWADWLEIHVNRSKTQLFFVSMSPTHERAEEWGGESGQNCYNETTLITTQGYLGTGSDPKIMQVVTSTIDELKTRGVHVQLLNITQLSEYRKEGHPSVNRRQWVPLTADQLSKPISYADCTHWCLPGVPDTWNELLFAHIFHFLPIS